MNITITMDISRIEDTTQLSTLTESLAPVVEEAAQLTIEDRYRIIEGLVRQFGYARRSLKKKERREVITLAVQATGLSRDRVKHLVRQCVRNKGRLVRKTENRHTFPTTYTTDDVALLVTTDNALLRMSGIAVKHTCERMYRLYGDERYRRLSDISVSHLYNLRDTRQYQSHALTLGKTKSVSVPIGVREKPYTGGKPGHIRVDTVHQGDLGRVKGVYFINLVDEVTQWEVVVAVPDISEHFLEPVLEVALSLFPFTILGFHSDNGGEYINKTVARILGYLRARQSKSRARRTNDNALVEGKNAAVIRKHFGHGHIAKDHHEHINEYLETYLVPFLNLHRPCLSATDRVDAATGKITKRYDTARTPFERLCGILNVEHYLKHGVTLDGLRALERAHTDLEAAELKEKMRAELFKKLSSC